MCIYMLTATKIYVLRVVAVYLSNIRKWCTTSPHQHHPTAEGGPPAAPTVPSASLLPITFNFTLGPSNFLFPLILVA